MRAHDEEVFRSFCVRSHDPTSAPSVLLLAAHPDDEVIGAGARLSCLGRVLIVHATDGSPKNLSDARSAGFSSRGAYARARRQESLSALALAGIAPVQVRSLSIADQEASYELVGLTRALIELIERMRPELVLTHPYEGGHPDHDACSFAAAAALQLVRASGFAAPAVAEFTSYHQHRGRLRCGSFLPGKATHSKTHRLSTEHRELKKAMFRRFRTQQRVLAAFALDVERFRLSPSYDFEAPPHVGQLWYERFSWGIDGASWRVKARQALIELGLCAS